MHHYDVISNQVTYSHLVLDLPALQGFTALAMPLISMASVHGTVTMDQHLVQVMCVVLLSIH